MNHQKLTMSGCAHFSVPFDGFCFLLSFFGFLFSAFRF